MERRRGMCVAAVLVLLSLPACGVPPGEPRTDGSLDDNALYQPAALAVSPSATDGPSDSIPRSRFGELVPSLSELFGLTDEHHRVVWDAAELLMAKCMEGEGIEYIPQPYPATQFGGNVAIDEYLGVVILDHAKQWGYHGEPLVVGAQNSSRSNTWPDWDAPDADAFYKALTGDEGSFGCLGSAWDVILGQDPDDRITKAFSELRGVAERSALASDEMHSVNDEWSACMRAEGYDFETPGQARTHYLVVADEPDKWEGSEPPPVSPVEIAAAVADAECKNETGLVDAYRIILWEAQQETIAANRPALEAYRDFNMAGVARAQQILSDEE